MEHLKDLLADHQLYHSDFQMDCFITGRSGGTVYGQYKQALRELHKRYRGLKGLYASRDLAVVDLDELTSAKHSGDQFEARRREIRLVQKRMELDDLERNVRDTEREFRRFYGQAVALKKSIGSLTAERRHELDLEMWTHKLRCMAAVDLMTGGLRPNTLELLQAVPKPIRASICKDVEKGAQFLGDWFLGQESELPQVELPAIDQPLALP